MAGHELIISQVLHSTSPSTVPLELTRLTCCDNVMGGRLKVCVIQWEPLYELERVNDNMTGQKIVMHIWIIFTLADVLIQKALEVELELRSHQREIFRDLIKLNPYCLLGLYR